MSLIKTQAILIKSKRYKERDKLLTYITEDYGKIFSLCKGSRVPLNKWGSSTEPPNVSYIQLYQIKDFFTLTEVKGSQIFNNIISSFQRSLVFSYISDILDSLLLPLSPSKNTYYLTLSSIYILDDKEIAPILAGYIFALKFLDVQGYRLEINKCVRCGKSINDDIKEFYLSLEDGGALCESCSKFTGSFITRLGKPETTFLKNIIQLDLKDIYLTQKLSLENYENLDKMILDYYYLKFKKRIVSLVELMKKYNKRSKVV